ncbi:MAG TPA: ribbon-helix-helix protein, CopG family [Bdellovibrionota bacterium]|nr:ribbon-helix-helix protein, CopG family [Bdellovibrionota bacterium]
MKIVKKSPEIRSVTLRISEETMAKIDKISEENDLSRQKLIEAILDQVLEDKTFVLKLK